MKAVILAAGLGRRLRPYTKKLPKCLININGQQILNQQVKVIRACGISDILVVYGFQADKVKKHCRRLKGVQIIFNPFYATTNSIISLWLSRYLWDEDLLIINSDIIFDRALLCKIINTPYRVAVLVNRQRKDGYRVRMDKGYVAEMRMDIPLRLTFGTYGGITKVRKSQLDSFSKALDNWIEKGCLKDWYEDAVAGMIRKGLKVGPVFSDGYLWQEIDTPEDLLQVRSLFAENKDLLRQ